MYNILGQLDEAPILAGRAASLTPHFGVRLRGAPGRPLFFFFPLSLFLCAWPRTALHFALRYSQAGISRGTWCYYSS